MLVVIVIIKSASLASFLAFELSNFESLVNVQELKRHPISYNEDPMRFLNFFKSKGGDK